MSLTWEQRKQIGEALGKTVYGCQSGCWHLEGVPGFYAQVGSEQEAWNAYQPDVLGEVIPWLQKNAMGWGCGQESMNGDYLAEWREVVAMGDTFSEAVCALMLAVMEDRDD